MRIDWNRTLRLAALTAMTVTAGARAQTSTEEAEPFRVDDIAMCQFEYHMGEWEPGDPDAPPGIRIVFDWVMPGKLARDAEYRLIEGKEVQVSHGTAGYHYGLMQIQWRSYVRDGVYDFEVMNSGTIEFLPGDVMVRRYRSYDPDTSSREYRETLTPVDENTRRNVIEYLDDERNWKEWGVFTHVRSGPRVQTEACANLGW